MADRHHWRLRLTRSAETDYQNILHWTTEQFGKKQARIYADTLKEVIEALMEGPDVAGARRRDEITEGLMTLHVARGGRRGRHFVLYRVGDVELFQIDVLRLLHDVMDLPSHLEED